MRAIQFQNKRVGSTFLQKAIDSHPDIAGIDEVFVNMARKKGMRKSGFKPYLRSGYGSVDAYLNNYVYKETEKQHTIFKLMYNQIHYHQGLFDMIKREKIPMIHLMRRNLVKQVISGLNAATTEHKPIPVSPQQLMNMVKEADNLNKQWKKKLKDHIKLTLYYEDIIGATRMGKTYASNNTIAAICNFFGASQFQLFATTKKKNKPDIRVYLPNYDKILEHFKGSKYEWMMKEKEK